MSIARECFFKPPSNLPLKERMFRIFTTRTVFPDLEFEYYAEFLSLSNMLTLFYVIA